MVNLIKIGLVILASLILQACATTDASLQFVRQPLEITHERGIVYTAAPGDVLYTEKQPVGERGATIQGDVYKFIWGLPGNFRIGAGSKLLESVDKKNQQAVYCSQKAGVFSIGGGDLGYACFRDSDADSSFETAEVLSLTRNKPQTGFRTDIEPVSYVAGDITVRDIDFEYVVILEDSTTDQLNLQVLMREQENGCVHTRSNATIELMESLPVESDFPSPLRLDHVLDHPRSSRQNIQIFGPADMLKNLSYRIHILEWNNNELKYKIDAPQNYRWLPPAARADFDRCAAETANNG